MKAPATAAPATPQPAERQAAPAAQADRRPAAVAQRQQQTALDASPRQVAHRQQAAATQSRPNRTGLPDQLKAGVENLSGYSLDDVKVHYNSAKPAQLQAHAYAQGTDIHVAPGQEKHLPHEAWHVVQQKQGRVQATRQLRGKVDVNDDTRLEREADRMGQQALSIRKANIIQRKAKVIIDRDGLKVDRDGDLKYVDETLPKMGGDVYRHMSPKHSRLKVAEAFFKKVHDSNSAFLESQRTLGILQNELTGYEYFTEHLGKQFSGAAEENKKLTKGEYDSILLAASKKGITLTDKLIDIELNGLAENYMYIYLSKHAGNANEFMQAVQNGSQLTLDAMWIFESMQAQIKETAAKLSVDPNAVLHLMQSRVTPKMAQKAMSDVAGAAYNAFVNHRWVGPTTQNGEPNKRYYMESAKKPVKEPAKKPVKELRQTELEADGQLRKRRRVDE